MGETVRRATATLIFVLLMAPASVAGAQQPGRCYPPPCSVKAPAPDPSATLPAVSPTSASVDDVRSPAPFVATGLLAVLGSLTLVVLRRRSHILRRTPVPVRASAPSAVGGAASHEPQPALR